MLIIILASALADLPYPIAVDLDSSYVAVFSIFAGQDQVAGVDYIFTYGPLASWYLPVDLSEPFFCSVALRAASVFLIVALFWSIAGSPVGLALSVGVTYVMLTDFNAPVLITLLAFVFAVMTRAWLIAVLLVCVVTLWGLVKFTGIVGFYLFLAYYAIIGVWTDRRSWREIASVISVSAGLHAFIVICVYAFYLDQSPLHFFDYLSRSFEVASGYSQFMRVGERRWSLIGYLAAIALVFGWHARLLRTGAGAGGSAAGVPLAAGPWRALALASYVAPVLFLAMKQGYTRQDGHEVASYIVAFTYGSLVLGWARLPGRAAVPVHALAAVGVAVAIHATQMQDFRAGADAFAGRVKATWSRALGTLALFDSRARGAAARAAEDRNRVALAALRRAMPLVGQLDNYDIFAPEQTLAALNPDQYRPRPVFQGYSAYTPALQDLNARHIERVPDQVLVDFRVVDGRYPNLEDGSALAQIALQFCPDDWYGSHVSARRTAPPVALASLDDLDWRSDSLISGDAVALPAGVVLGRVGVELTWLGRAAAAAYRLPELVARLDLSDGRILHARLIPTGREYPAILSPLLASTGDLAGLWAGTPKVMVTRLQLRTSSILKLLFKDLTIRHAALDWSGIARRCAGAASTVEPPPAGTTIYQAPRSTGRLEAIDAHPNRAIAVPVARASHLRAVLKLRSPERTADRTDGLDVRIYGYRDGATTPIAARRITADEFRSAPAVTVFDGAIAAEGGYLVFETSDRNPAWDWFEWEDIVIR